MVFNKVFILGFAVNINDLWCEPVSGISILTSFHPFFVEKDKKLAKNHILTRGQIISRSLLYVGLNLKREQSSQHGSLDNWNLTTETTVAAV